MTSLVGARLPRCAGPSRALAAKWERPRVPGPRPAQQLAQARLPRARSRTRLGSGRELFALVSAAEPQQEGVEDSATKDRSGEVVDLEPSDCSEEEDDLGTKELDTRVYDRLMDGFLMRKPEEYPKLLSISREWENVADNLFAHIDTRAGEIENDPDRQLRLYELNRRLKKVHRRLQRMNDVLAEVKQADIAGTLEEYVARRGESLTATFFEYANMRAQLLEDEEEREQIASLLARLVSLVQAFHDMQKEGEVLEDAQEAFDKILNSSSLEEMESKIDMVMDKQKNLSPALVLTMAKAWAGAKESNLVKDEVKDILGHLYMRAKANMGAMLPPEIRILRHVLTIEDPRERIQALSDAFTPGDTTEAFSQGDTDVLYTSPEKLLFAIDQILQAYERQKPQQQMGGMMAEAAPFFGNTTPALIPKLRDLSDEIQKYYC